MGLQETSSRLVIKGPTHRFNPFDCAGVKKKALHLMFDTFKAVQHCGEAEITCSAWLTQAE